MGEIAEFFGFVSPRSSIWSIIGYGAFILIIVGVLSEKYRKALFVIGPFLLALYAIIFLVFNGSIVDFWSVIGSLGLLGIVFGIVWLPNIGGFLIMAIGGVLLVIYGFVVGA